MTTSVDPTRLKLTNDQGTQGVLVGTRCRECKAYVFGAAVFCQACTSSDLEPVELSPRGTLYSFTIVRVPPSGWPGPVPYMLGQVELPEGPQVLAEIIGCQETDLKIGMEVELTLQSVTLESGKDSGTAKAVYKWRPVMSTGRTREASP